MQGLDPKMVAKGSHKQLNHYFKDGNLQSLYENLVTRSNPKKRPVQGSRRKAKTFSVRTRWADAKII